jgi:hypothetical protein
VDNGDAKKAEEKWKDLHALGSIFNEQRFNKDEAEN